VAENIVVKDQLTDAMVDGGADLTRKLDELGLKTSAAFWFFMPDLNEWRLLFASSEVSAKGSRDVYRRIGRAIDALGRGTSAVPLSAVGLLENDADLLKALRRVVALTGPGLARLRISKSAVNGHFIDDVLVYRME
jgi:hypothetical protein